MLGKIAGALIGRRMAGRNSGATGAMLGAGAVALGRRGLGPLGTAMALGWGARKLYQWNRDRRRPAAYPRTSPVSGPAY